MTEPTRARCAVLAALEEPAKFKNAFIPVYDQVTTPADIVETFTRRTGVKARRVCLREILPVVSKCSTVGVQSADASATTRTPDLPCPNCQFVWLHQNETHSALGAGLTCHSHLSTPGHG